MTELQELRSEVNQLKIQLAAESIIRDLGQFDSRINNGTGMLFMATPSFQEFESEHSPADTEELVWKLRGPSTLTKWRELRPSASSHISSNSAR